MLQHRRAGREHEERQPDTAREQEEQPADRVAIGNRHRSRLDHDGQDDGRRCEHNGVQNDVMTHAQPPRCAERVSIPGEHHDLEEHDAAVPDHRHTAEDRQHHLGNHRLDQEQQKPAEEHGRGEQRNDQGGRLGGVTGARGRRVVRAAARQSVLRRCRLRDGQIGSFHGCPALAASGIPARARTHTVAASRRQPGRRLQRRYRADRSGSGEQCRIKQSTARTWKETEHRR